MNEFIQTNWKDITLTVCGIVTLASVIVKVTPTKKDDKAFPKVLNFVLSILNLLALNPKQRMDVIKVKEIVEDDEDEKSDEKSEKKDA